MLTIRREQLASMSLDSLGKFERRLLLHVRSVFPEVCRSCEPEAIEERIRTALARARAYGIHSERDVALFVDLGFGFGPDFETHPGLAWIQEILQYRTLPGHEKIARIYSRLRTGDTHSRAPSETQGEP